MKELYKSRALIMALRQILSKNTYQLKGTSPNYKPIQVSKIKTVIKLIK